MRHLVREQGLSEQFRIDSAGTSSYHVGEPPHPGSQRVAAAHGVSLKGQHSRRFVSEDFQRFQWLVAMDGSNARGMCGLADNDEDSDRVVMLLDYAGPESPRDVPDPYYEGGFERVFRLVQEGCEGLLREILAES